MISDEEEEKEAVVTPSSDYYNLVRAQESVSVVMIEGRTIGEGSKVRLKLSKSHADAQDLFLNGKVATVEGIYSGHDARIYVAVSLDDDPGREMAKEFHQERNYFFFPEELEVVEEHTHKIG